MTVHVPRETTRRPFYGEFAWADAPPGVGDRIVAAASRGVR